MTSIPDYGERGGVLNASPVSSNLKIMDLSLEQNAFTVACALIDSSSVSFFVNVYYPDTPKYFITLENLKCFEVFYKVIV